MPRAPRPVRRIEKEGLRVSEPPRLGFSSQEAMAKELVQVLSDCAQASERAKFLLEQTDLVCRFRKAVERGDERRQRGLLDTIRDWETRGEKVGFTPQEIRSLSFWITNLHKASPDKFEAFHEKVEAKLAEVT